MNQTPQNYADGVNGAIMLVDDEPANLNILERMLADEGYQVQAFPNGEMALRAAVENPPDMLLLDILMPGMDGYEVCRKFKEQDELNPVPVLFLSALDEQKDKVKAFGLGAVDYISKPLAEPEVLARVKAHLQIRNYSLNLEQLVDQKVQEISDAQMAVIFALSRITSSRDEETGNHLTRVQHLTSLLAKQIKSNGDYNQTIDDNFINTIYHASILHDIGKVSVPDRILLKPAQLTSEEFNIMKEHTIKGAETLEEVHCRYPNNNFIKMGINIARHHHEQWNGEGYPDQLQGEEIPLSARIMGVVDLYDALRSERPYKEALSHNRSIEILKQESGTKLDPCIIKAFLQV